MPKPAAQIIEKTANGIFMQSVKLDNGLTQERITEIVFDFVFGGTKLPLSDFVAEQVAS